MARTAKKTHTHDTAEPEHTQPAAEHAHAHAHEQQPTTAAEIVQDVAASTEMPAEPGASHDARDIQHHQEQARKPRNPAFPEKTFPIDAGLTIRLIANSYQRRSEISFAFKDDKEKPSETVRGMMKDRGFRFDGKTKVWARPINPDAALSDRLDTERLFAAVVKQLQEERGVSAEAGRTPF